MKNRPRIVSGLVALAALFLAPLAEASLTRPTSPALEAPSLTLAAAAPEPSEFSLFDGTELAPAAAEPSGAERFHPLAAVSLLSKDGAEAPLVSVEELSYPKTRYRVFGFFGAPLVGVERGVSLELHWGCASFSCGFASGTVGWLSQDPLGDVDSPNLYSFVGMRPHEKTDPLGLCPACGYQAAAYVNQELTKAGQATEPVLQLMQGAGEGGAASGGALLLYSGLSLACGPAYGACFAGLTLGTMAHVGVQNASSRLEAGQTPSQAAVGGTATAVGVAPAYAAVTNKDIVTQQNLGMTAGERARTGGQIAGAAVVGAVVAPLLVPRSAPALPTVRYNRAKHYGGGQTRGPIATALRQAGEGTPCQTCGAPQVSGTPTAPSPQHEPSLMEHYYLREGFQMTDEARRTYAGSPEAFNGTQCLTCQRKEGQALSVLSREIAKALGLD